MIRKAELADIPAILRMAKAFFDQAPMAEVAEWDEASMGVTLAALVDGSVPGTLLAAEVKGRVVGMAAYLFFPLYFNLKQSGAQEIFWYIEPEHRTGLGCQMFDALEAHAKARGAQCFFAASTPGLRTEALARVYAKRGYKPSENTFLKRL